ncbi:CDP-alcohol phosphatidyltransferase [Mucilaginibacter sp. PPCGB 2223]|uniref:CDP-alcohol phosphatidyltransferase family protein n=1 Tax=Mucilaginibacter sp. PPCGB 2223 TaxID=1886027 RepID=UPI00082682EF|nr:CDP-alcohol phosphatidyltransferase family protein [Mucilaginibacter sp. PPCGB 2223]OCX54009.1 CDP-alcohol phosphatidyltransferase [Mucilaginibacter sp. PPCGB 2223]
MKHKPACLAINLITMYRIIAAPILFILIFAARFELFKWMLAFSFLTDAVDGFLARKYNVTSKLGATIDSIGDDLTVAAGIFGIIRYRPGFLSQEYLLVTLLITLYLAQVILALVRYGRMSSFHTYAAKLAAIFQGVFLILFYFISPSSNWLFILAALLTVFDLLEEILLVIILPRHQSNVKGLYWVFKRK